ncbi:MAG: Rne/Rng family ribonuclease [Alphaproteobacteria bacterium]
MAKRMLIDATHPEETRVVILSGNRLEEFDFETSTKKQIKGNIYLAKVTRVEPSLQAAFVEYGGNRHGFLAFSEIHPDYYRIPVADREALLAEHAAAADDEDDLDEEPRRRGRRQRRGRGGSHHEAAGRPVGDEPGGDEPGGDEPGGDEPGGDEPGGDEPGGDEPGGEDAGEGWGPDDRETEQSGAEVAYPTAAPQDADFEPPAIESAVAAPAEDTAPVPEGEAAEAASAVETSPAAVEAPAADEPAEPPRPTPPAMAATDGLDVPALRSEPIVRRSEDGDASVADAEPSAEMVDDPARGDGEGAAAEPAGELDLPPEPTPEEEAGRAEAAAAIETLGGDELEDVRPRRPRSIRQYKIQEVIKRRQIMLVQVTKEERGNKGAALTTYLSLAGRYCVLMPNSGRGGGVSRKIVNPVDRRRLKSLIEEMQLPEGMSVIVRTAGSERSRAEIKRDLEYLLRLWDEIRELTMQSTAPALVYEEGKLIKRAIRDLYSRDIDEISVEGEDAYREAKDFMRMLMPSHAKRVQPYRDPAVPLFSRFQIDQQIDAIHSPIVQLKSGGYIVINPTEALVAIDVNSGRSTRERNIEETAYRTNIEAADEIARQLRLRDLAGLIVIDFIDMEEPRNQHAVERRLKEAMKSDRARIQIGRISPFGLLELSRQRLRPSIFETSTQPCPHCGGTGHIRSTESTALHVLRAIEEEGLRRRSAEIRVTVPTSVALYILNQKRAALADIERRYAFVVLIDRDDALIPPDYRLERLRVRAPGEAPPLPLPPPVRPDDEDLDSVEDEAEDGDEAAAEEQEPSEHGREERQESDDDGRRRRRRRRRRDDRRESGDRPEAEERPQAAAAPVADESPPADVQAGQPETDEAEGDDEGEEGAAEGGPAGAAAGHDDDSQRRRRRRGRRGGRRRGRREDEGAEGTEPRAALADDAEVPPPGTGEQPEIDAPEPRHETSGGEPPRQEAPRQEAPRPAEPRPPREPRRAPIGYDSGFAPHDAVAALFEKLEADQERAASAPRTRDEPQPAAEPEPPTPAVSEAAAVVPAAPLEAAAADPEPAAGAAPSPVSAEPAAPEPVVPEPIAPEPIAPEPVAAEPVAAEPVAAEPVPAAAPEPAAAEVPPAPAESPVAAPAPSEPVAAPEAPPRPARKGWWQRLVETG